MIRKLLGLLTILLSSCPSTLAASVPNVLIPTESSAPLVIAQNQLFNPKFAGFDQQPRFCDLRLANGWFYWYRQGVGTCTVVLSSNQADATTKAQELADSSYVTQAGIGYRLLGDPFY